MDYLTGFCVPGWLMSYQSVESSGCIQFVVCMWRCFVRSSQIANILAGEASYIIEFKSSGDIPDTSGTEKFAGVEFQTVLE